MEEGIDNLGDVGFDEQRGWVASPEGVRSGEAGAARASDAGAEHAGHPFGASGATTTECTGLASARGERPRSPRGAADPLVLLFGWLLTLQEPRVNASLSRRSSWSAWPVPSAPWSAGRSKGPRPPGAGERPPGVSQRLPDPAAGGRGVGSGAPRCSPAMSSISCRPSRGLAG